MSQGQRTSTGWKGEGYIEPIRGQAASMLLSSSKNSSTYAIPFTRYQCGECGVILGTGDGFPARCAHCGVLNYLK